MPGCPRRNGGSFNFSRGDAGKSRSCGRKGMPAEVVLRLLVLKHVRNWSYDVLEREVRANLVYRDFTRVGSGNPLPDRFEPIGVWGEGIDPHDEEDRGDCGRRRN